MARRRPTRAERRRAEREAAIRLARERGAAAAGDVPVRLRIARHQHQLDRLERDGVLTGEQARAGHRLCRDYQGGGALTRLRVPLYQPGARPPKKQPPPTADSPGALAARERFETALRAAEGYAPILVHVCLCDLVPAAWRPALGVNGHGHPIEQLREGLTLLAKHYAEQRRWVSELAPPTDRPEAAVGAG
jgi:hypothetical protein